MRLNWVELRDFRNHAHTKLQDLPEGLVVIVGPNGEGKTNLMEAMNLLYSTSSPRVSANEALVREGAESGFVRGEFETLEGHVLVETEIRRKGANRIHVDRSPLRRRRDLRRRVRSVLFGPFDLTVIVGDPSKRRDFMDEVIVALDPAKDSLTTRYERVLRQRNRLLKEWEGPGAPPALSTWDEQLVRAGAAVIEARDRAVRSVAPHAAEWFRHLAGYELVVDYRPNVATSQDLEASFAEQLERRRGDELQRRTSLVGPHRDDLWLAVRDLGARLFSSHGETWGAALCLRLAQAEAVRSELGEPPLLLVDDPYSALDPSRRDRLAERLASAGGQVVISVADEADIPAMRAMVLGVRAGKVSVWEGG